MTKGFIKAKKYNFFAGMFNKFFSKRELLPAPVEYTQKEVILKMEQILKEVINRFRYKR